MVKTPPFREAAGLGGVCAAPSNPFRDTGSRSGGLADCDCTVFMVLNLYNQNLILTILTIFTHPISIGKTLSCTRKIAIVFPY